MGVETIRGPRPGCSRDALEACSHPLPPVALLLRGRETVSAVDADGAGLRDLATARADFPVPAGALVVLARLVELLRHRASPPLRMFGLLVFCVATLAILRHQEMI